MAKTQRSLHKSNSLQSKASFETMGAHELVAIIYEKLSEQAELEAHQTRQFRFEIFKISLGWTLFSVLILSCGWGMNLQRVYDIGLIATVVCILFSCAAFCINGIIYKHLAKKAAEYKKRNQEEKNKLKSPAKK